MNAFRVAFLFTLLVGVALATNCSLTCTAPCQEALSVCHATFGSGSHCANSFRLCEGNCNTLCTCPDRCEAKCAPALDECITDSVSNVFTIDVCHEMYAVCAEQCQIGCPGHGFTWW